MIEQVNWCFKILGPHMHQSFGLLVDCMASAEVMLLLCIFARTLQIAPKTEALYFARRVSDKNSKYHHHRTGKVKQACILKGNAQAVLSV